MSFENSFFEAVHSIAGISGILDVFFVFLAKYLAYIVCIAVIVFFVMKKDMREKLFAFYFTILSLVISRGILAEIIGYFYARPRPFESLGFIPLLNVEGYAFPSGHASFFFALASALWYIDDRNKKWAKWVFVFAFVNGIARVVAGVHWPSDIIGGIFVGIVGVLFTRAIIGKYKPKITLRDHQEEIVSGA